MKRLFILLFILSFLFVTAFAQKPGKYEENFSSPFQLDSSEYYIIPKIIDGDNRDAYGKILYSWDNYVDVVFYNSKTNQSKKVFGNQQALIEPFFKRRNYYYTDNDKPEVPDNILPAQIVYLARTENYNNDRSLNSGDPAYLYISSKTGENLRQITPAGFAVQSWTVSHDKKMILVKGKKDDNGNKKFGEGDNDIFYRIDLDDDISKIICYQIAM